MATYSIIFFHFISTENSVIISPVQYSAFTVITCGGSFLPLLDDHQLVYAGVECVGEVTLEILPREAHVDHKDSVPHDVPPPVVVREALALYLVVPVVEGIVARVAEDQTLSVKLSVLVRLSHLNTPNSLIGRLEHGILTFCP